MADVLIIEEAAPPLGVQLPLQAAAELIRLGVCDVAPDGGDGTWQIRNVRKVGVVRIGALEIVIRPKVPIRNLLWMLSFADSAVEWRPESVGAIDGEVLTDALARAFAGAVERATAGGLVRQYRQVDQSSQVVRGRWDIGRQIRLQQGSPLPAEISFDEFDADTPENRILLAALVRLVRLPGLSPEVASRLRTLVARFDGVGSMRPEALAARWRPTRRTEHLAAAYRLAVLVLSRKGIEHHAGGVRGAAFLVTMSTVFERFVEAQVRQIALAREISVAAQEERPLDVDGRAVVRPDLLLRRGETVVAILDAKYKQEKPSGFPNADLYQALAYAVRIGLPDVYLVYAKGFGEQADYVIENAAVVVHCVALDLDAAPDQVVMALRAALPVFHLDAMDDDALRGFA